MRVYLAWSHDDFWLEEETFIHLHTDKVWPEHRSLRPFDWQAIAEGLADDSRWQDAALSLIRKVGVYLWNPYGGWPTEIGSSPEKQALTEQLRRRLWRRLEAAWLNARLGETVAQRRAAAVFLKHLGETLAGDARGRSRAPIHPFEVRDHYWRSVFRLEQARELMKQECRCSRDEKIRRIAEACGFAEDDLRGHLLTTKGERKRPLRVSHEARKWTAVRFGVTEQTVSNYLAGGKPHRK